MDVFVSSGVNTASFSLLPPPFLCPPRLFPSDNMELSKQLGTRHRAGVGISEVTDSVTIIVSEETGQVSVAQNGRLLRNISSSQLREVLEKAQNKKIVDNNKLRQLLKGRVKHEEKNRK